MFSPGFTKIELIIVVVIIALGLIFDVAIVIYFNNKIHDIRVLADISQIRSGLEVYLQSYNYYPAVSEPSDLNNTYLGTEKLCLEGFKNLEFNCQRNILNPIPNYYLKNSNIYRYLSTEQNRNYKLQFTLKTNFKAQGLQKGLNCADNLNIVSNPCF